MFHLVVNVEPLETERFLVVLAFGNDGYLVDACCPIYEDAGKAIDFIRTVLATHGQTAATLWTSDKELYGAFLSIAGLGAELKHRNQTQETGRFIAQHANILTEFHEIKPIEPKPELPRWRRWLFIMLEKIGGNGKYEI
jgi:hypothetical protein